MKYVKQNVIRKKQKNKTLRYILNKKNQQSSYFKYFFLIFLKILNYKILIKQSIKNMLKCSYY